jgi:hypothetical protein
MGEGTVHGIPGYAFKLYGCCVCASARQLKKVRKGYRRADLVSTLFFCPSLKLKT